MFYAFIAVATALLILALSLVIFKGVEKDLKEVYIQPEAVINHSSIINCHRFLEVSYQGHQYLSYARHLIHAQHCQCLY